MTPVAIMLRLGVRLGAQYWRETAIALLALVLMAACHARDNALLAKGAAEERYRVADSTLHVVRPQLARVDTLVVRDTLRVHVTIDRVVTLTDTVLHHLTDTVLVKQFVTRADSAAQACTELARDCAAFRQYATATITALEAQAAAAPIARPTHHRATTLAWTAASVGLGYLGARWIRR